MRRYFTLSGDSVGEIMMWYNSIQFEGKAFDIHLKAILAIEKDNPIHSDGHLMNEAMIENMVLSIAGRDAQFERISWSAEWNAVTW